MKAMLTDERFSDPGWIFERKLDGIRCIAIRDGERLRMLSRNDLPLNDRYPEIADALEAQSRRRFAIVRVPRCCTRRSCVGEFANGEFARPVRRGGQVTTIISGFDCTSDPDGALGWS